MSTQMPMPLIGQTGRAGGRYFLSCAILVLISLSGMEMTGICLATTTQDTVHNLLRKLHPQSKKISVPEIQEASLAAVRLDSEVYMNSQLNFADLRILDSQDHVVPFAFQKQSTPKMNAVRQVKVVDDPKVKPLLNDKLEITFATGADLEWENIDGLTIDTRQKDFELRVTVQTKRSDDDPWQDLVKDFPLFDYSQYMDVRDTEVKFEEPVTQPKGTDFRILVSNATLLKDSKWKDLTRLLKDGEEVSVREEMRINQQPLRIENIEIWQDTQEVNSKTTNVISYPIEVTAFEEKVREKSTTLHLKSNYQPLVKLKLQTASDNFRRVATVKRIEGEQQHTIAEATLTKIHLGHLEQQALEVEFPETRSSRYAVDVVNNDNRPLSGWNVIAEGPVYEMVFVAQQDEQYRLIYGRSDIESAVYDTAAIEAALGAEVNPVVANLSAAQPYQWDRPLAASRPWWKNKWLFGGIVSILVMILGLALWNAAKRLDSIPK